MRARPADGSVRQHQTEYPHQVWAMEFQFEDTADGWRFNFYNLIDEHIRLCLAIRVGRRCKAKDVVAVLEMLTIVYPAPTYIHSDNGPEFIAYALLRWSEKTETTTVLIESGSPWQNCFADSLLRDPLHWSRRNESGGLCNSCLSCFQGRTLLEVRVWPESVVLPVPAIGQALGLIHRGEQLGLE